MMSLVVGLSLLFLLFQTSLTTTVVDAPELHLRFRDYVMDHFPTSSRWSQEWHRRRQLQPSSFDDDVFDDSINPCNSELFQFQLKNLLEMDETSLDQFIEYQLESYLVLYKLNIDNNEEGEYFGSNGEYNEIVLNRMEQIEAFWSARQSDAVSGVTLLGAHGTELDSTDNLMALCFFLLQAVGEEATDQDCMEWATFIESIIVELPGGFSNPLLSLNAFAFIEPEVGDLPAIVVGDGIIEFLEYASIDTDLGIDFVMGHEYIHILQAAHGLYSTITTDDDSPSTELLEQSELMADALSAYYLAHEQGDNLSVAETNHVSSHARTLGDAVASNEDYSSAFHGTPGQRECAALWGAQLARLEDPDVLTTFTALAGQFVAAYPSIYDGSSSACSGLTTDVDCSAPAADAVVESDDGVDNSSDSNTGTDPVVDTSNSGDNNMANTTGKADDEQGDGAMNVTRESRATTLPVPNVVILMVLVLFWMT
jgi:hypothetical protein